MYFNFVETIFHGFHKASLYYDDKSSPYNSRYPTASLPDIFAIYIGFNQRRIKMGHFNFFGVRYR